MKSELLRLGVSRAGICRNGMGLHTKVFHRALPHETVEHPGARPIVASSAALHEVKFPKLIGRDGWVWEAPCDKEIPPKNLGKRLLENLRSK